MGGRRSSSEAEGGGAGGEVCPRRGLGVTLVAGSS